MLTHIYTNLREKQNIYIRPLFSKHSIFLRYIFIEYILSVFIGYILETRKLHFHPCLFITFSFDFSLDFSYLHFHNARHSFIK